MEKAMIGKFFTALAIVLALPGSAVAGQMADGRYSCTLGGYTVRLGDIEIEGNTYRGPAHDGDYSGDYHYDRTDAGTIDWAGPLGGLSSGGNEVVSTVVRDAGLGREGFDIMIQTERGTFQTVSCGPE